MHGIRKLNPHHAAQDNRVCSCFEHLARLNDMGGRHAQVHSGRNPRSFSVVSLQLAILFIYHDFFFSLASRTIWA